MRILTIILVLFCISCSIKNIPQQTDNCTVYYQFLKDHWSQKEEHLYDLKILDDIQNYDYKDEAYIDLNCLKNKDIETIEEIFGEPSKSIKVRDTGALIYCLDKSCLKNFQTGGKYLWISYKENLVTKIHLEFFPLIHEGE